MRYLIAETSWDMMSLAQDLLDVGTLVSRTDNPEDLPDYLKSGLADLLLFDADHLNRNGVTLRGLRLAAKQTPIVLLSSNAAPEHKASWLADGADAVIDPCSSATEIQGYLLAIARRALGFSASQLSYGSLSVCLARRGARISDCPIKLSPKIYEMLEYLALRPGRLITRSDLLTHIYGFGNEPETRIFDVYACNLRSCLKATNGAVELETVRGAGFRLSLHAPPAPIAA
ncbi:winged helix-turn-helix transcriptional regulator [Pelagimonas varians]|uniref:Cell cycle response regulator CtrA n=1 Tax=Pelagimonas varians TaxID=696760 RepID=A0A238KQR5_9RHOB|nr:response regulator transcription factor [Pelagimonas varians]PYG28565.1 DNA-binding response OmpR family regulator [Pelagimonas varians]SMX45204.1 Cell cycle response regulator CtrA [Pelagimonas varians]